MNYGEVDNYIKNMDEAGLVTLCNEIYDWMYVTGILEPNCSLLQLSENIQCSDTRYIADKVINVASKRLNKVMLLLTKNASHEYLKSVE